MPIVRHKIYGSHENPTIYYLTGYTGTIKGYQPHIYALLLGRFRVMVFEYDTSILLGGQPRALVEALKDIEKIIERDKKGRAVAGVYGVSLGSWFGLNVLASCNISHGMFNTAGASVARAIWENAHLKKEKAAFQKHGYSQEDLDKEWAPYRIWTYGSKFRHKKIVILNSVSDKLVPIAEARANIRAWQNDNLDVELITSTGLNHGLAIARHMFRLRKTLRFFKITKKQKQEVVSYPTSNRRG